MSRVSDVAELLTWMASQRPPTLGSTRLLCVDGPAGSGKTTLGHAMLAAATDLGSARLLHMDDMYEGWNGLGRVAERVLADLVRPLGRNETGRYRRYDWHQERFAEWHRVEPVDLLILEGVGSGDASYHDAITLLVWVDAPRDLRITRGVARDGKEMVAHWMAWMEDEESLFRAQDTRARAHAVVDGTGEADTALLLE